jgi:hypothetical protein
MISFPHSRSWSCDKGWHPLIIELIEKITPLTENMDIQVTQIKEKFGGLSFYINHGTDEIFNIIQKYEEMSYKVCEVCGNHGKYRRKLSWKRTLCFKHYLLDISDNWRFRSIFKLKKFLIW